MRAHSFLPGLLVYALLALAGCSQAQATATPLERVILPTPTGMTQTPQSRITPSPSPFPPIPLPSGTPSPAPVYITAETWEGSLQAPVILYHRFLPDSYPTSTKTKMRLSEFQDQLQAFYDAGFSLVPLHNWLDGDIRVPKGRRPLILTMDDAIFADQIFLEPDGNPSPRSGLGVLWQFSQLHPDFGFSAALFTNLGDKLYANRETSTWFLITDGWREALARTIAWCIDHDVIPYNHTFQHQDLSKLDSKFINEVLRRNDETLRDLLKETHREDLIPRLDNYIALPYGTWPVSASGKKNLLGYKDPEGEPVKAVFDAGYYYDSKYLPAPFSAGFDRLNIPRITTNTKKSVEFLTQNKDLFPAAGECRLGPLDPSQKQNVDALRQLVQRSVQTGTCATGIFRVGDFYFDTRSGAAQLLWPVSPDP